MSAVRAVLFDLDGTLVDSLADFVRVLNRLRAERALPDLEPQVLRDVVTFGTDAMLERALGLTPDAPEHAAVRAEFLDHYARDVAHHTRFFPGVESVLAQLEDRGIGWGIVTNKQARFTSPLVHCLGIAARAGCIVSGDTTQAPKPHPGGLELAARTLECAPRECLYVGDAHTDVQAAHAAGMRSVVALYGYIPTGVDATRWAAHHYIGSPTELMALFGAPK